MLNSDDSIYVIWFGKRFWRVKPETSYSVSLDVSYPVGNISPKEYELFSLAPVAPSVKFSVNEEIVFFGKATIEQKAGRIYPKSMHVFINPT